MTACRHCLAETEIPAHKHTLNFAFTGLIRCGECGRAVTAEEKHQVICGQCKFKFAYRKHDACPRCETPIEKMVNPKFLHYTYYHCSKSRRPACSAEMRERTGKLKTRSMSNLRASAFPRNSRNGPSNTCVNCTKKRRHHCSEIIQSQQKAYQECVQEIDNLVKLKTSSGNADGSQLSDEEYGQRRGATAQDEKDSLEELLNDAGHRVEQQLKLSEQTFEFACTVQERFAKGDPKTKKEILTTIGSNLILKDKKLLIEARKPFFILENTAIP